VNASIIDWTIPAVLTFLVIGLPTLYLLVLSLTDDEAFDGRVRDFEPNMKPGKRAQAYASGKDVDDLFGEPLVLSPLAATDGLPESAPKRARAARRGGSDQAEAPSTR
jgi:hypothetical protein